MIPILSIAYLFASLFIGVYLYYWSAVFKKLGESSVEELNEGEEREEDKVDESEIGFINNFGSTAFLLIGILIWAHLGIAVGKIAGGWAEQPVLKWVSYILIYIFFLRIPFGVGNKLIRQTFGYERFPEKVIFSLTMVLSFVLAVCCYEAIPNFFKWHLMLLE